MGKRTAYLLSVVLHPLLMPSYLFLIIILFAPQVLEPLTDGMMFRVLLIVIATTFILPLISIGILKMSMLIKDFLLHNREDRILPFLFVTMFYGISAYMFYQKIHLNDLIFFMLAGITALLLLLTFITFFWKISIHSAGLAGIAGFLVGIQYWQPAYDLLYPIAGVILIGGLVMSARLRLNAHWPSEVYAGGLLGFLVCFFSLYIFL